MSANRSRNFSGRFFISIQDIIQKLDGVDEVFFFFGVYFPGPPWIKIWIFSFDVFQMFFIQNNIAFIRSKFFHYFFLPGFKLYLWLLLFSSSPQVVIFSFLW